MKKLSRKTSIGNLIAVLPIPVIILSCYTALVSADTHSITIWNDLGTGQNLTIDCRSDTQDLGVHRIAPGESHKWSFVDPHHIHYFCDMISGDLKGQFDIYDRERDLQRCEGACAWYVRPEGLYIHYHDGETTELMFNWQ